MLNFQDMEMLIPRELKTPLKAYNIVTGGFFEYRLNY